VCPKSKQSRQSEFEARIMTRKMCLGKCPNTPFRKISEAKPFSELVRLVPGKIFTCEKYFSPSAVFIASSVNGFLYPVLAE